MATKRWVSAESVLPDSDELVDKLLRGEWTVDDVAQQSGRPATEIEPLAERCIVDYVKRSFDALAAGYDDSVFRDEDYKAYRYLPALALEHLSPGRRRVLDLGCGTGLGSQEFVLRGCDVEGIDVSRRMIELARRRGFTNLHCVNLEKRWPVLRSSFDIVIALGVMEYILHPERLLRQANAVMKPEGILAITIPKRQRFAPVRSHTKRSIIDFFRTAGLRVLHCERFPGWVYEGGRTIEYYGYLLAKRAAKPKTSATH